MGAWVLPQVTLAGADGCSNSLLTRTSTQVSGIAPSPRGGNACVTVGTQVVVFGGSDRAPLTFDDLWVLETGGEGACMQPCAAALRMHQMLPRMAAN